MALEDKLGIWGNKSCVQCGACCHDYYKHLNGMGISKSEQCEYFKIENNLAYCTIHEKEREKICEDFFCGNFSHLYKDRIHERLRKISLEILKTFPKPE